MSRIPSMDRPSSKRPYSFGMWISVFSPMNRRQAALFRSRSFPRRWDVFAAWRGGGVLRRFYPDDSRLVVVSSLFLLSGVWLSIVVVRFISAGLSLLSMLVVLVAYFGCGS